MSLYLAFAPPLVLPCRVSDAVRLPNTCTANCAAEREVRERGREEARRGEDEPSGRVCEYRPDNVTGAASPAVPCFEALKSRVSVKNRVSYQGECVCRLARS
jgi:hypothetical protein